MPVSSPERSLEPSSSTVERNNRGVDFGNSNAKLGYENEIQRLTEIERIITENPVTSICDQQQICSAALRDLIISCFPKITSVRIRAVRQNQTAPRYLIRDDDGAYGQAFTNRVRTMGIRDRPIAPRSPWQNPYVERLIGTLRRDCLDHVLIFGERHLRRILTLYSVYYNETRTHLGLGKDAPQPRPIQRCGTLLATPILSGLHNRYSRI
jgi:Integrase core domain